MKADMNFLSLMYTFSFWLMYSFMFSNPVTHKNESIWLPICRAEQNLDTSGGPLCSRMSICPSAHLSICPSVQHTHLCWRIYEMLSIWETNTVLWDFLWGSWGVRDITTPSDSCQPSQMIERWDQEIQNCLKTSRVTPSDARDHKNMGHMQDNPHLYFLFIPLCNAFKKRKA